jgi:hypothetical protein
MQFILYQFKQAHTGVYKVGFTYVEFMMYRHWELQMPVDR